MRMTEMMAALSPASLEEDADTSNRRSSFQSTIPIEGKKSCRVCGDRANGFNFGVLTCESCKAFFRRNAAKIEEIKCPFSNNCDINAVSRRYCQACRLNKCVALGLRRDWINEPLRKPANKDHTSTVDKHDLDKEHNSSDEEITVSKAYLKDLIRKSKRKPAACECTCECGFYPSGTKLFAASSVKDQSPKSKRSMPYSPSPYASPMSFAVGSPASAKHHSVQPSPQVVPPSPASIVDYQPQSSINMTMTNGLNMHNQSILPLQGYNISQWQSNPMLSAFAQQQFSSSLGATQLHLGQIIPQSSSIMSAPLQIQEAIWTNYVRLSAEDVELLAELLQASQPLNDPIDPTLDNRIISNDLSNLMEVVKITSQALRRLVCMARVLKSFSALPIQDRTNLLRGNCMELLILRGVTAYDPSTNSWNHGMKERDKGMQVKLEVLQKTNDQHYEEHKQFLSGFSEKVRKNDSIMLVLMAIVLFAPVNTPLIEEARIKSSRSRYELLLLRILECEYIPADAQHMYGYLMQKLKDLTNLNKGLNQIYHHLDLATLDPLIIELLS